MTEVAKSVRPRLVRGAPGHARVDPRVTAQAAVDLRVTMVVEVIAGRPVEDVATAWDVEPQLLHRWVRDFLVAGTAAITNRPDPDEARQRDRFMAAFAHELRTPVSVAQGWAQMLDEGDIPEEQVADSHHRLAASLGRLADHIRDVEMTASVSLGRIRVARDHVAVADLLAELDDSPELRVGAEVSVFADPALLLRIVRDLCATAAQDPAPSNVHVEVREAGAWHEIRAVRTGEPIHPMVLKALFDPFGANDDNTGVTIGLYLARALTVAHGGVLGAEGDDQQTVLYTRLPRPPAAGPTPAGPGSVREEGGKP